MVANLDAVGPAVVVGDRTGYLYAYHLADGSLVQGWPVFDGGPPIDSTPSVASVGGTTLDSVFVGTGNAQRPDIGGYVAYGPNGQPLWHTSVTDPASDNHPAAAVQASLTVANLQGNTDVFAGSLDQESYALNASNGSLLPGWPFFSADSVFSTAAAGDLYGTGQQELVMGGASSAGSALGLSYSQGGHVRVLNSQGAQIYDYDTTQEIDSSPAIGGFLAGGATGIVVGTGSFYAGASDTDTIKAFTARLGLVWSETLDGLTNSSPALAAVQGGTQLDVVEGTGTANSGSVWVLNGANGATVWHQPVVGRVIGSVVAADLTGAGYQDLLVPTVHGVEVLDGRTGAKVAVLGASLGFQNSPLVTDDPNGTIGITIAGYNGANRGVVQHYEIPGSNGALAVGAGSWPMFHHDPGLSGASSVLPNLGRVTPAAVSARGANTEVLLSWSPPAGTGEAPPSGYNIYEGTAPGHELSTPVNGATPVTSTGYAVTGLTNGTRYYFEVTALNPAGEGAPAAEASAVPAAPPGAPVSVFATAGTAQVSLSWAPPATNGGAAVSSYNIYLSTTGGLQGTKIAQVPGTSYTAAGLQASHYLFLRSHGRERRRRRPAIGPGHRHSDDLGSAHLDPDARCSRGSPGHRRRWPGITFMGAAGGQRRGAGQFVQRVSFDHAGVAGQQARGGYDHGIYGYRPPGRDDVLLRGDGGRRIGRRGALGPGRRRPDPARVPGGGFQRPGVRPRPAAQTPVPTPGVTCGRRGRHPRRPGLLAGPEERWRVEGGRCSLLRVSGPEAPKFADRRGGRHPRRPGLLAGGGGRWHLRLRGRPLLRLLGSPTPQPADRGHRLDPRRPGLLAGGGGRWHLRLRGRPFLRVDGVSAPQRDDSGHRGHQGRPGLLAGGGGRWHLRFRGRHLLRFDGFQATEPADSRDRGDG